MGLLRGAIRGAAGAGLEIVDKKIEEGYQMRREARLRGVNDAEYTRGRTDKNTDVKNNRKYSAGLLTDKNTRDDKTRGTKRENAIADRDAENALKLKIATAKAGGKESLEVKSLRAQYENTQKAIDKSLSTGEGDVAALKIRLSALRNRILAQTHPKEYDAARSKARASILEQKTVELGQAKTQEEFDSNMQILESSGQFTQIELDQVRHGGQTHSNAGGIPSSMAIQQPKPQAQISSGLLSNTSPPQPRQGKPTSRGYR